MSTAQPSTDRLRDAVVRAAVADFAAAADHKKLQKDSHMMGVFLVLNRIVYCARLLIARS